MPRYIDADKVLETMRSNMDMQELYLPIHFIDFVIEDMPTADVQPVRYGKWVVSATQKHVEVTYECSECQHEAVGEYEKTPFCGGCGARMEGDGDE